MTASAAGTGREFLRTLAPGQRCRVLIGDIRSGTTQMIHESRELLLEAPNWTADGRLVLNGDGRLWTLRPGRDEPLAEIRLEGVPALNNDHVLAPDGETIYVSANDWHIYEARLSGGPTRRVTADDGLMHFLHGVSPDGRRLAYIAIPISALDVGALPPGHIRTVGVDGKGDAGVTRGDRPDDGSEYSPDGEWLYCNTEAFTLDPGHAQIARLRPDGSDFQRLTENDRVDWFPHLSSDGRTAVYLSYPPGTIGHPPDLEVRLMLVRDLDWAGAQVFATVLGGQGTINVNSWSPDGSRFAYVDYPLER